MRCSQLREGLLAVALLITFQVSTAKPSLNNAAPYRSLSGSLWKTIP